MWDSECIIRIRGISASAIREELKHTHTHTQTHWGTHAGPVPVADAWAVVPVLLHRRLLHSLVLDLHFGESSVFYMYVARWLSSPFYPFFLVYPWLLHLSFSGVEFHIHPLEEPPKSVCQTRKRRSRELRAIHTTATCCLSRCGKHVRHDAGRPVNIEESQPFKNRNLSRLTANLSQQNWSSERTVFIKSQKCLLLHNKHPVLVYPVIFPV